MLEVDRNRGIHVHKKKSQQNQIFDGNIIKEKFLTVRAQQLQGTVKEFNEKYMLSCFKVTICTVDSRLFKPLGRHH